MNSEKPIEAEVVQENKETAVVKSTAPVPAPTPTKVDPKEAKDSAIASLTMSAYSKAATLKLTKDQTEALTRDFPDEAFKPGAAGKEHLLYIEHAFLRDRLNEVFGLGGWAIVPRSRWAEQFKTEKGKDGSRVYVEAMLVVDGCFVAEAVGEMEYYPHNPSQNYGDAVEGAKTAALRRCCKEFGIGLQAWKKDWCEGWWQRHRQSNRPPQGAPPQRATPSSKPEKVWTASDYLKRFCELVDEAKKREMAMQFFIDLGWLLPQTETLESLPDNKVPHTKEEMELFWKAMAVFAEKGIVSAPYPIRREPGEKPIEVPRGTTKEPEEDGDEEWRSFPVLYGESAGTPLGDLEKKTLWGWWNNFEVTTEYKGKPKKPETIAKERKFREMLDQAGEHYQFEKKD